MENPLVSVIISVYNKMDWLKLVLAGLEEQSFRQFEVVIADDGSKESFVDELKAYIEGSGLKIRHVWQEDKGFRKTRILNKALLEAEADYLVFLDGDCLPQRHFVADHWHNRQENTALAGRRANLSPQLTQKLSEEKIRNGYLDSFSFKQQVWSDSLRKRSQQAEKSVRLPGFIFRLMPKKSRGILGCNFSVYKKDLLDVNGFDMRYEAPAIGEDTDLEYRMRWAGKEVRLLRFQAVQYHLYHRRLERVTSNDGLFAELLEKKQVLTPCGIREL